MACGRRRPENRGCSRALSGLSNASVRTQSYEPGADLSAALFQVRRVHDAGARRAGASARTRPAHIRVHGVQQRRHRRRGLQNRRAMITTQDMRIFSLECLKWAQATEDASNRETIVRVARMRMKTASAIDLRLADGALAVPDLRRKLD